MQTEGSSLSTLLVARRDAVVNRWLQLTLQTYPETSRKFLTQESDLFRNPVGHSLKEGLRSLFDGIAQQADAARLKSALDGIVRIRAVQDFSASEAVSFVFLLKQALRTELRADLALLEDEYAALEARIDSLTLAAFDLFMQCREKIFEIKSNEAKRMVSVLQRSHQKCALGLKEAR